MDVNMEYKTDDGQLIFNDSICADDDKPQQGINGKNNAPADLLEIPESVTGSNFVLYKDVDIEDPGGDRFPEPTTTLEAYQFWMRRLVHHLSFRIFTILLILTDVIIVIVDVAYVDKAPEKEAVFQSLSLAIVSYFVLEVGLRIFAVGPKLFFHQWIEVVDFSIVLISFFLAVIFASIELSSQYAYASKLLVAGRLIRIIRIVKIFTEKKQLAKATRQAVSQNKRRYQKDGFDLDLCYITERVIAMSFPSRGLMAMYRNPIREVAKFLDFKHKDQYKVFNLCSERTYDESLFHYRVERILIDDHNVPKLSEMIRYADCVREWMRANDSNVIAVHCKGGKGRTGTMICTWLVDSGLFEQAEDSLSYFGDRRTDLTVGKKFQGVETPSQSRYVGYFERVKKELGYQLPPDKKLKLKMVRIEGISPVGNGDGSDLTFTIYMDSTNVFECDFQHNMNCQVRHDPEADTVVAHILNSPVLYRDVKFKFMSKSKKVPTAYEKSPFFFWFYTSFIENNKLRLGRDELDNPHKKKMWNVFKDNFVVELEFAEVDENNAEI
ncbi:phosphatidylinositol 3,4,5-trisphosphate 3-phosphatase TPTE2-like isoform X2 [Lineus longissimus]|uniref:phosphatidylinositol 3,4,5-trisphosphate 3-phosphatase TPTE2-like isoform X2 n=1 Tax=Lineus longissimus TaxID=88925 RepID=UPI002B4F0246